MHASSVTCVQTWALRFHAHRHWFIWSMCLKWKTFCICCLTVYTCHMPYASTVDGIMMSLSSCLCRDLSDHQKMHMICIITSSWHCLTLSVHSLSVHVNKYKSCAARRTMKFRINIHSQILNLIESDSRVLKAWSYMMYTYIIQAAERLGAAHTSHDWIYICTTAAGWVYIG